MLLSFRRSITAFREGGMLDHQTKRYLKDADNCIVKHEVNEEIRILRIDDFFGAFILWGAGKINFLYKRCYFCLLYTSPSPRD